MDKKQKTLAAAGVAIASAAVVGIAGANLANAADTSVAGSAQSTPGTAAEAPTGTPPEGSPPMRDGGGTLTPDAASKAVSAALGEVSGGTAHGVRALSDGTYVVAVEKSDDTHVHVLVDASFAVTSVEEGGPRGLGGPGGPGRGHGAPRGEAPSDSSSPTDANGSAPSASPST